jgi:lipopolysaccharide/colanic/teichoic acid biosynthesis glycosyltransferase
MLDRAEDPEKEYIDKILPEKIRLAKEYIERRSQWFDLVIVVKTVWYLVADRVGLVSKNA